MANPFTLAFDASSLASMARLESSSKAISYELTAAFDALEGEIAAEIVTQMHFDKGYATGELEGSIVPNRLGDHDLQVGTDVAHAKFVEYGTGQRGAASGVTPEAGYSYGGTPGMEAEPYMQPAFDVEKPLIVDRLEKAVGRALGGLP